MYLDSSDPVNLLENRSPIKNGWVAFGDLYAAGIGAGSPVNTPDPDKCMRGDGGYPWKLDEYLQLLADDTLAFTPLPCSSDVANDITKEGGQLDRWYPSNSDIATLSIIGNDFKFGLIVTTCIVGYISSSDPKCDKVLASAEALLDPADTTIVTLLFDVWIGIIKKSVRPQFTIYQTGYPQFFQNSDHTCDDSRFWVGKLGWYYYGQYLTQLFRARLNELLLNVNAKIKDLINKWNANLPRPQIVFLEPDVTVYPGYRYYKNSRKEPLEGTDQDQVDFFYPLGDDYVKPKTTPAWPTSTVNSANCKSLALPNWVDRMYYDVAVTASTNSTTLALLEASSDRNGTS